MNLLKNVMVVGILLAVAGGVYIAITTNPQIKPPPGVDDGSPSALNVEMPGGKNAVSPGPAGPVLPPPGATALGGSRDSLAPAFTSPVPTITATAGKTNPPAPVVSPVAPPPAPPVTSAAPPVPPPTAMIPGSALNVPGEVSGGSLAKPSPSIDRPPTDPSAPADSAAGEDPHQAFARFMEAARSRLKEGGMVEVHSALSRLYGNPGLNANESSQLMDVLNQVAGTVVYSRQHLLEPPYTIQAGETLAQIGDKYKVPWQLLAKINGIRDPEHLTAGQQLKVIRGPFNAVIHLSKHELTLLLNDRYAGCFSIGVGRDQPPTEGAFPVVQKGPEGAAAATARVIVLANQAVIHPGSDQQLGRDDGPGSIAVSERDMNDIYDILVASTPASPGSQVVIQR